MFKQLVLVDKTIFYIKEQIFFFKKIKKNVFYRLIHFNRRRRGLNKKRYFISNVSFYLKKNKLNNCFFKYILKKPIKFIDLKKKFISLKKNNLYSRLNRFSIFNKKLYRFDLANICLLNFTYTTNKFFIHLLFNKNIQYNVYFLKICNDFLKLYYFLKKQYRFSKHFLLTKNKFIILYGVTYFIFFKSFFYLDIFLKQFFLETVFKKHRYILIILKKLLNTYFLDFFKKYNFYGTEIHFFGKLGGFGGSKKRKYRIFLGYKTTTSEKFRTYINLYEYNTLHGRIGSKITYTTVNIN